MRADVRNVTRHAVVEKKLASLEECSDMTGLSTFWWRRQAHTGKVASTKLGTRLLIPMAEVERVIAENTRPRVA